MNSSKIYGLGRVSTFYSHIAKARAAPYKEWVSLQTHDENITSRGGKKTCNRKKKSYNQGRLNIVLTWKWFTLLWIISSLWIISLSLLPFTNLSLPPHIASLCFRHLPHPHLDYTRKCVPPPHSFVFLCAQIILQVAWPIWAETTEESWEMTENERHKRNHNGKGRMQGEDTSKVKQGCCCTGEHKSQDLQMKIAKIV